MPGRGPSVMQPLGGNEEVILGARAHFFSDP